MIEMAQRRPGIVLRTLLTTLGSILVLASASGCDSFSNLTVNCQVGIKNDGQEVAGCQFTNTGRGVAQSCVKVHVLKPAQEDLEGLPAGQARTFVSDTLCSGPVEPGAVTDPAQLAFSDADARTVAESCVRRVEGEPHFVCQFKIEELGDEAKR